MAILITVWSCLMYLLTGSIVVRWRVRNFGTSIPSDVELLAVLILWPLWLLANEQGRNGWKDRSR